MFTLRRLLTASLFGLLAAPGVFAQLNLPQNAQTDLYFPHLTSGGSWSTRFSFVNPNSTTVVVGLWLYSNSGAPLTLNFGSGPVSQLTLNLAPNGTTVLQTQSSAADSSGVISTLPDGRAGFPNHQHGSGRTDRRLTQ